MLSCSRVLFMSLAISASITAHAQWATLDWQRCIGGPAYEEGWGMAAYPGGGFVITGFTEAGGGNIEGFHGGTDVLVARVDANGELLWAKAYGGTGSEEGLDVCATENGDIWVVGRTGSSDGDVTGFHEGSDFWEIDLWVMKLNADGELLWQRACGGSGDDRGNGIAAMPDGGAVVTGYTRSTDGDLTVAEGPVDTFGNPDIYALRFAANGEQLWQRRIGANSVDEGYGACLGDDGNIYLTGRSYSSSGEMTGSHGDADAFIAKLTPNGDLVWARCYGGSSVEDGWAICAVDGGLVFTGSAASSDGDVTWSSPYSDFWVVATDLDGNIQWSRTATQIFFQEFPGYSAGFGITPVPQGGVVVATRQDWGENDFALWWFGPDGASSFGGSFGGPYEDICYGVAVDEADGGIGMVGTNFLEGGDVVGNHGGQDAWLIELSSTIGFTEVFPGQEALVWYDEAEGLLCATGSLDLAGVRLWDAQGRQVFDAALPAGGGRVQLPAVNTGVYVAEAVGKNGRMAVRTIAVGSW